MLGQGARKFVFLSRTGVDKPAAKSLVEDLEAAGVHVIVSRASVTEFSDVVGTIAQIQGSIGGVVHAAMGLDVSNVDYITVQIANEDLGGTFLRHVL